MGTDYQKYIHRFRNKYLLASTLYIIWVCFFDDNNLIERVRNLGELNKLKENKEYYIRKIKEDDEKLKELKTDNVNLEKYAREQYLMKKENEEVFVIVRE